MIYYLSTKILIFSKTVYENAQNLYLFVIFALWEYQNFSAR